MYTIAWLPLLAALACVCGGVVWLLCADEPVCVVVRCGPECRLRSRRRDVARALLSPLLKRAWCRRSAGRAVLRVPPLTASVRGLRVSRALVHALRGIGGGGGSSGGPTALPLVYFDVVCGPLATRLVSHPSFPLPVLGGVHVTNGECWLTMPLMLRLRCRSFFC